MEEKLSEEKVELDLEEQLLVVDSCTDGTTWSRTACPHKDGRTDWRRRWAALINLEEENKPAAKKWQKMVAERTMTKPKLE